MFRIVILLLTSILSVNCGSVDPEKEPFELTGVFAGDLAISFTDEITDNIPTDRSLLLNFSVELNANTLNDGIDLTTAASPVNYNVDLSGNARSVSLSTPGPMLENTVYTVSINDQLKNTSDDSFTPLTFSFKTSASALEITSFSINGTEISGGGRIQNVPTDLSVEIDFTTSVNVASLEQALQIPGVSYQLTPSNQNRTILLESTQPLQYLKKYQLEITNALMSEAGGTFKGFSAEWYTQIDSTYKFPQISDEELLTKIQEATFGYFWDFAHPVSGLARERNTSGDVVTTGGSGFGIMGIIVGIKRGFITRQQGVDRLEKVVDFLADADRFHGVWPHWLNGNTGKVIPFSANDNGGDLVETAFLMQGLLTARQYLDSGNAQEASIRETITRLWREVEWDWYTQGGQNVLYWLWSPDYGWEKNLRITGWNESLIVYVLAAASPTHSIPAEVYHEGWTRNGAMANGQNFFGQVLPLGPDLGGPLFFSHYSFLGLDPRNLEDQYADYWTQNVNHTLINRAYCISNPKQFVGYSEDSWGLTASDNNNGYSAHSPQNDLGVITPTAAVSSIVYTPEESMKAIRHFYYVLGDKLWGEYGFYDAFNPTEEWVASSYLAIDQGPILVMIENYRSGLLWDLFMSAPEVKTGLTKLGFENGF